MSMAASARKATPAGVSETETAPVLASPIGAAADWTPPVPAEDPRLGRCASAAVVEQPPTLVGPNEGGAAAGSVPHPAFGFVPRSKSSAPPRATSVKRNHGAS